jgi:hypothetical protein
MTTVLLLELFNKPQLIITVCCLLQSCMDLLFLSTCWFHSLPVHFVSTDLLSWRTNVVYMSHLNDEMEVSSWTRSAHTISCSYKTQASQPGKSIMNTRTERCEIQRSLPLHSQDNGCQLQPRWKQTLVTHSYIYINWLIHVTVHILLIISEKSVSVNTSSATSTTACYGQLS